MTNPVTGSTTDPLGAFVSAHISQHGSQPIPLISTRYDISIEGGFAVVEARRTFRNAEETSIEATLTFPLPVEAVLFSLEAEHDGRKLKARAHRQDQARNVYESAIEKGKTAVLHEELLRGIHMLSVAHIAPGAEIAVTLRFATTLAWIGERWMLRVPLTVGQVYGHSPLADSDVLESNGANGTAEVVIHRSSGRMSIAGTDLDNGRAQVPLNRPIDIEVIGADATTLHGVGADGRAVALQVAPLVAGRGTLDLAILVDRSGSMGEACSGRTASGSKHDAVIAGLGDFARHLGKGDAAEIWEFDDNVSRVGATGDETPRWPLAIRGSRPDEIFARIVQRLRGPGGGTELGAALEGVLRTSAARDILLITDGKSYALKVQELARYGRRVAVVLVGDDSLEANVGHLAGLTGGSIFVAAGDDIAPAVAAAAAALRSCPVSRDPIGSQPTTIEAVRGGAIVKVAWGETTTRGADDRISPGVAALAAGLALARMSEGDAAALAEREGLCSHLTSLVLVDEAAPAQAGIPAMRKVPLPTPEAAAFQPARMHFSPPVDALYALEACERLNVMPRLHSKLHHAGLSRSGYTADPPARPIDWNAAPAQLLDGDLSSLDKALADRLRAAADMLEVQLWADELGVTPIVLIVAALAHAERARSRTADRIARKVLGKRPPTWIDELQTLALRLL